MTARLRTAALFCISLFLVGCLFDHTAERIAGLRITGDLDAARDLAVDALSDSPGKMDAWRELATTDIALSRRLVSENKNATPVLTEAALICAAYNRNQQGKLDNEWGSVARMAAVEN